MQKQVVVEEESSEEEEKIVRDTTKRKAPTDCSNPAFTSYLNTRGASVSQDF